MKKKKFKKLDHMHFCNKKKGWKRGGGGGERGVKSTRKQSLVILGMIYKAKPFFLMTLMK